MDGFPPIAEGQLRRLGCRGRAEGHAAVHCTKILPLTCPILLLSCSELHFQFKANCQKFDNLIVNSECWQESLLPRWSATASIPRLRSIRAFAPPPPGHGDSDKSTLLSARVLCTHRSPEIHRDWSGRDSMYLVILFPVNVVISRPRPGKTMW